MSVVGGYAHTDSLLAERSYLGMSGAKQCILSDCLFQISGDMSNYVEKRAMSTMTQRA